MQKQTDSLRGGLVSDPQERRIKMMEENWDFPPKESIKQTAVFKDGVVVTFEAPWGTSQEEMRELALAARKKQDEEKKNEIR